ncbi:MAG TPA: dihydrodipicolinate synthase family protein [Gemmataceae bacterium]|nr:dihydrodipicolinate synthase family protein [Gemmataceae bacterium]
MHLKEIYARRQPGRRVFGMAALLLPFTESGAVAEDAFAACLQETVAAGLTPAVNMDTGYVNLLTPDEKARILKLTHAVLGKTSYVAGAFIEGRGGEVADLFQREIALIIENGGTPILFQTSRLHNAPAKIIVETYYKAVRGTQSALAFELGKMFAASGEIWPVKVVQEIMQIPQIKGMKHSSLDRVLELERLALRDRIRPDFQIFTGNDLGIDMIEYGSNYLLGLAAFSPAKFAERDRFWENGDPRYFAVADALQHLGNVAFRPPVAAYKHSAAIFLHLLGKIPTEQTHPRSPTRPSWEKAMMQECAVRLALL